MSDTNALTPQQIFTAYRDGTMPREKMIELIARFPFAEEPATDGYDWITPEADGPTWREVSAAKYAGTISREDYAAIFELRHSKQA